MKRLGVAVLAGLVLTHSAFGAQSSGGQANWWSSAQSALGQILKDHQADIGNLRHNFTSRLNHLRDNTLRAVREGNRVLKSKDVEQKKNLAIQLWKIRDSLDMAALLQPELLEELTGVDAAMVSKLEHRVANVLDLLDHQLKAVGIDPDGLRRQALR